MRRLWILIVPLVIASCERRSQRASEAAADTAGMAESAELTAELLAPVRAVSLVAVEQGQLAARNAARPDVRSYAQTVATDHRALVATLDSAARSVYAPLQETAESRELANTVRMAHAGLESLPDADFDLAFIRAQVESHRQLLDTIDRELNPVATSTALSGLLADVRGLVDAHLTRGRQLLGDLLGEPVEPAPAAAALPVPRPQPPPDEEPPPQEPEPRPPPPDTVSGGAY